MSYSVNSIAEFDIGIRKTVTSMKVNVIDLLQEVNACVDLNIKGHVDDFEYMGEHIAFAGDVELNAKLTRVQSKHYKIEGTVSADVILCCGRCLKDYKYNAVFPVELHFTTKEKAIDDDTDRYYTDGDTVELDEAIQTNLIMNLPAQRLCREACKGLCPVCGADLNNKCCNCADEDTDSTEDDVIDARFAALKDFFEK